MKRCPLFPNVSGIFIFKGEHSPQYDYICSHCVSKNSLSIWRTLIPRFLSVTLLLHDQENMWNKTSFYGCILLLITYYVYTLSLPCYHYLSSFFTIEALLSLNARQNVQEQIVIINIGHHLCYCYLYFYNSLRSTSLAISNF